MDNEYYKQIFSANRGFVYEYSKPIPDGSSLHEHIIEELGKHTTSPINEITIVQLPKGSFAVHCFVTVDDPNFILVADLSYTPEPVPEPEPEPEPESEPESEPQQEPAGEGE